jgi:hypothetical protein
LDKWGDLLALCASCGAASASTTQPSELMN